MSSAEKICRQCNSTYPSTVVFCPADGTVLESTDGDALVGKVIADRYRLISRIGEGGMGQVYLAEHVHMRRRCAVKFLNPDLAGNAPALKRFMREAENASRIDHPNVVTMYDFGESADGMVYLAMEFVDGESLRKRIERDGVLPPDMIASIVRQTASALQVAHQLHIVHRDLKPDNIMLVTRGDEVRVKVVDFGIAKAKDPAQKVTVTGAIIGTPDYMSPEQVTGDPMDGGSDQYALALVAVKMLTGKLPFGTATGVESLTSRLTSAPAALRTLKTDVAWPQQLQDVIARALSIDPTKRYPNVVEFARSFDRAVSSLAGVTATTVPELQVGPDAIPATRQRPSVSPPPAPIERTETMAEPIVTPVPRARSRMPLLAAGVVGIGLLSAGLWYKGRPGESPEDAALLNRPVATGDTLVAIRGDSTVRLQSTIDTGRAAVPPAPPAPAGATAATRTAAQPDAKPRPPVTPREVRGVDARKTPPAVATKSPPRSSAPVVSADTTPPVKSIPTPAAAPATTPTPTPAPAKPAAPAVGEEFARLRALVRQSSSRQTIDSAVAGFDALLPRATARSDSIRILYTRAQANALQEDLPRACSALARAFALAGGTSVEAAIAKTSRDLSCP